MRARPATPEERKAVAKRHADGESIGDIAKALGRQAVVIKWWIYREGGTVRPDRRVLTPEERASVVKHYLDDQMSMRAIGEKLGCSEWLIKQCLKSENVLPRRAGGVQRIPAGTAERCIELYVRYQLNDQAIAHQLGISRTSARRMLDAAGITPHARRTLIRTPVGTEIIVSTMNLGYKEDPHGAKTPLVCTTIFGGPWNGWHYQHPNIEVAKARHKDLIDTLRRGNPPWREDT